MMNKDLYKAAVNDVKVNEELVKELAIKMKKKPQGWKSINTRKIIAAGVAILLITAFSIQYKIGLIPSKKVAQVTSEDTNIYMNKIEGMRSAKLLIPEGAYSKDYTMQQLTEFFGRDPMPVIPKDFKSTSDGTNITFDPQGKMLFMSTLIYSKNIDDPESPLIEIKLNKNALPPKDCLYNSNDLKESTIKSTKVVIGTTSMDDKFDNDGKPTAHYDVYSAEFIYKEVGYNIIAKRTDSETFLNLLKSIIK